MSWPILVRFLSFLGFPTHLGGEPLPLVTIKKVIKIYVHPTLFKIKDSDFMLISRLDVNIGA